MQDALIAVLCIGMIVFSMKGDFTQKIKEEAGYLDKAKDDICTWGTSTDD
jgi:hypothetical protein